MIDVLAKIYEKDNAQQSIAILSFIPQALINSSDAYIPDKYGLAITESRFSFIIVFCHSVTKSCSLFWSTNKVTSLRWSK